VSYNGHYVAFPRLRRGFDSRHPHHDRSRKLTISVKIISNVATFPKKYLHDRLVLLLLSLNAFAALFAIAWVGLKLVGGRSAGYIVQYRQHLFSTFKTGSVSQLWSFVAFAIVVAVLSLFLSARVYRIRRQLSLAILALGLLLEIMTLIVANALLALR
jgi:hypothetical protein